MSDNTLDKFMADVRAIEAKIDELTRERDTARDLAARLTEEVIEMRELRAVVFTSENTRRPTDDTVRLEQVAAILRRFVDRHSESVEYPPPPPLPPSLLRALAIAERED